MAAGRTILDRSARKNVLLRLDDDLVIRVHFRMTGPLMCGFPPAVATTRAYFELMDGRGLIFDDPRALGILELMSPAEAERLCSDLGPEPLSAGFTAEMLVKSASQSKTLANCF
jgi:formamidopyrimidine-DNA glycosylase